MIFFSNKEWCAHQRVSVRYSKNYDKKTPNFESFRKLSVMYGQLVFIKIYIVIMS